MTTILMPEHVRKRVFALCTMGWIFIGGASQARGCTICITALADSVLPPIQLWVLLAMTWFVSNGAITTFTGIRHPWQPGLLGSLLVAFGLLVLGAAMFGPFTVLILFVPAIRGFVGSLLASPSSEKPRGVFATRLIGWVHASGVVCAAALMAYTHLAGTPEDYICKWGFYGSGRRHFEDLRSKEPASLDSYRYLAQHADDWVVAAAAERIGEIGEPEQDVPLLRNALLRFGAEGPFNSRVKAGLERLVTRQRSTQQNGETNGSGQIHSETNRTSSSTGSRR